MLAESVLQQPNTAASNVPTPATMRKFRRVKSCARPIVPRHELVFTFLSILVAVGFFWFLANQSAEADRLNYNVYDLEQQLHKVTVSNASLTSQVSELSRPERILSIAQQRLHMQFTAPLQVKDAGRQ